jgi:hypothetical protein
VPSTSHSHSQPPAEHTSGLGSRAEPSLVQPSSLAQPKARSDGARENGPGSDGSHDQVSASAFERAATWLSALCAVHCLLVPVASAALPLVGASTGAAFGGTVDHVLNILVVVGGALSALVGYRRHHDLRLSLIMVACVAVYLLGHALESAWYGVALAVVGGLGLAASSFVSARRGHVHHAHEGECAH